MAELPPAAQLHKIITCVLPMGRGREVLNRLRKERSFINASVHHARGVGADTLKKRGRARFFTEKEVLVAVAREDEADEIFEFLYFAAGINEPHAGMVFMERAFRACPLVPPDLPDEV